MNKNDVNLHRQGSSPFLKSVDKKTFATKCLFNQLFIQILFCCNLPQDVNISLYRKQNSFTS